MTDPKNRTSGGPKQSNVEFFTVGPPLHAVRPGYVRRAADEALFACISSGRDAYLFAPDRSGKTSLVAATSARLQNHGFLVATLDLAQIGERDAGEDSGRWYYSVAYRLLRQLRVKIDLQAWWQDKAVFSHRQRLYEFYIEVVLANTKKPVVVFIDELQCIENLKFADDLIESVSAAHTARATEPDFERLNFVLVGECDPHVFRGESAGTTFAMMEALRLDDFSRENMEIFVTELGLNADTAKVALDRIYYWTNGQPYLVQKIARTLARDEVVGDIEDHVDRVVQRQFGSRSIIKHEPHMSHIQRRVLAHRKHFEPALNTYGRVRKGIEVFYEPESKPQRILLALGLLIVNQNGVLGVRNRIYEMVFTARWANENLPLHWRGPAIAAGLLLLLTALPFWYTQLLPKPYARVLTSGTLDLENVAAAYRNLRSFPGHAATADRLFVYQLKSRASLADDELAIAAISEEARRIPGQSELGDQILADYWDRKTMRALRVEHRDEALLASLESLVVATPHRRRVANALVGKDYPFLVGTARTEGFDRIVFDASNKLTTMARGPQVQQWGNVENRLEQRPAWAISALEITPLLRRVIVDRPGSVARLGLTINVSHMRLDDLRVRLIAPSGRAIAVAFDATSSVANEELRFTAAQLQPLVGEPLSGTWTLSLRDESAGFAGHLVGWKLSLNSQVLEEDFERGLDIPEPVERESDSIWFADDGRYAVARSLQSDSARLWDLAYAQPARTIAVPADEQVLGIGENAETLVTLTPSSANVWDTRSGRRRMSIELGPSTGVELVDGGRGLLSRRSSDLDTTYELWSLATGQQTTAIAVAGSPASSAVDPTGAFLAVADYDRAVRVWDLESGNLVSQLDLRDQPTALEFAHGGRVLSATYLRGLAVWRIDDPSRPLLTRRGADDWHVAFSPSGERFLAGSERAGFQVFRSEDGAAYGPPLDSGLAANRGMLLAFSDDERLIVTGAAGQQARYWRTPAAVSANSDDESAPGAASWFPHERRDLAAELSPGGDKIAVGDHEGHVNVVDVSTAAATEAEPVNYLGHFGRVTRLAFSRDGSLIASAASDGSIRIWDAADGTPRGFRVPTQSNETDRLRFSHSMRYLAALIGQRVLIIDVQDGTIVVNRELGEPHSDVEFANDDSLYLAGESGSLRRLFADQLGVWTVESVWRAPYPLRRIGISPNRQMMIIVDSRNVAQVFDIRRGTIGTVRLDLPGPVSDILFGRRESQVLFRTSRWIHRADISRSGIHWRSALRAPEAAYDSSMVFDRTAHGDDGAVQQEADDRLLMFTRESGYPEIARLDFSLNSASPLFGTQLELAREWRTKLTGSDE